MMHSIVVATDFSEVANNAVHFACQLAADYDKTVTVFHSYVVPVSFSDNPMPVMPLEESRKIAEESMQQLTSLLKSIYKNVEVNSHVTYGDITDSLYEYCEQSLPWIVVIGNSAEDQNNLWLGSNVTSAMKNLPFRIMAVPASAQYQKPQKLCIACDYKEISEKFPGKDLTELANSVGAALHVLNIDHNNKHFGTEMPLEAEALHNMIKSADPVYHYIDHSNVIEGIQEFASENNIDWLIVVPHKYSFFEGLFHKSHTSAMVRKSHIPIIALPER